MRWESQFVLDKRFNKWLSTDGDVQKCIEDATIERAVAAEKLLKKHIYSGAAEIDIVHGKVDWYIVLSDERGQKAALSIEYGRTKGEDKKTGIKWGDMDGLYILHKAANLPIKRKAKVRM